MKIGMKVTLAITLLACALGGSYSASVFSDYAAQLDRPTQTELMRESYEEFRDEYYEDIENGKEVISLVEKSAPIDGSISRGAAPLELTGTAKVEHYAGAVRLWFDGFEGEFLSPTDLDDAQVVVTFSQADQTQSFTGSLREFAIDGSMPSTSWVVDPGETLSYSVRIVPAAGEASGIVNAVGHYETFSLKVAHVLAMGDVRS